MDAERLFFISMGATWLILFYHVFLTVGGYKHFLKTMHDDDVDMKMDYYPFVSVLVPAHMKKPLLAGRLRHWEDLPILKIVMK